MKRIMILVAVGACLLASLAPVASAQVPVIPFKVIRTIPHTLSYSNGLAWDNETIWVANSGNVIEQHDPYTGTRIKTFTAPNGKTRGLAHDGTHLWSASWYSPPTPSVFTIDTSTGSVVKSFLAPFTGGKSHGLAWDGSTIWLGQEGGDIYQMDPKAWTVINSLVIPHVGTYEPRDLAWDDKSNNLWVSFQSKHYMRKVSPLTGSFLEEFQTPYTYQQGCTWDGWFLWATGSSSPKTISQIDVTMPFMELKGSLTPSTSIQFELTRADNQAGNLFVVGWSGSGTSGFPVGGKIIPLSFDNFTLGGLALIDFFKNTIDSSGSATTPNFPWPNVPAGISFWVCGVTLDTSGIVSICEPIKYLSQ